MPNLAKAERILCSIKPAVWKLTAIINDKDIYDKLNQAWELLDAIDAHLRLNATTFCSWCKRPVFDPIKYKNRLFHKRCIHDYKMRFER